MATLLMLAAYGGSDIAVRYRFIEHGVGLDSVSVQCLTALVVAAMYDYDGAAAVGCAQLSRRCRWAAAVDVRSVKQLWRPQWHDGAVRRGGSELHGQGRPL
jgi:hypothetical protein